MWSSRWSWLPIADHHRELSRSAPLPRLWNWILSTLLYITSSDLKCFFSLRSHFAARSYEIWWTPDDLWTLGFKRSVTTEVASSITGGSHAEECRKKSRGHLLMIDWLPLALVTVQSCVLCHAKGQQDNEEYSQQGRITRQVQVIADWFWNSRGVKTTGSLPFGVETHQSTDRGKWAILNWGSCFFSPETKPYRDRI